MRSPQVGPHLGLHCGFACPRWGTPRASPQPPGSPGGDITVKPEVFLTPPRARATVYSTSVYVCNFRGLHGRDPTYRPSRNAVDLELDVHTSGDQRMPKNLQKSCVTAWWEALAVQMRSLRWCRSRFDVRIVTNHNHHFSGSINDFANQKNR